VRSAGNRGREHPTEVTGARYVSRLAESWVADAGARPWRTLDGSIVLADLSGFTRLTEVLTGRGPEGVEVLHEVLTRTFDALLGPGLGLGGDVLGFAGDAALVWFSGPDHITRAVESAGDMAPALAALPASRTGGSRLQVSVGVHTGTFAAVLAGVERRGLFVCGPEMSTVAALQADARPGQVLMSPATAGHVEPARRGASSGRAVALRRRRAPSAVVASIPDASPTNADERSAGLDAAQALLSPAVHEVLRAPDSSSDHRAASIGFVRIGGLDEIVDCEGPEGAYRVVQLAVETMTEVTADLGVDWLDVDVGVDCVKLMLAAGAPRAVDHDEDRLLLAIRQLLDRCPIPLRAGAQRGRVFAALLGHAERRSYTVLGDPVNVAARALGFAGDGDLIVGDGLGVAARRHVSASSLGPIELRNRAEPMAMWRVDTVVPHGAATSAARLPLGGSRRAEWGVLTNAWKRTVDRDDGVGCSVVIVSEPGMGASQLIDELVDLVGPTATVVVAHPFQQSVPYGAVTDTARQLARSRGVEPDDPMTWLFSHVDGLAADLQDWAALVRRDLSGHDDRPVADPLTRAMQSRVVLAALLRCAAPQPWLLAIDDFDRVDDVSRAVFTELVADSRTRSVMFVASVGVEFDLGSSAASATVIRLEPLSDDAAVEYLIHTAPMLRDDQIARVVQAAAGNPFVLAELARQPDDDVLPDSLHRLGAALVDRLLAPVREVVRDAAAFGTTVHLDTFARVMGRPELADNGWWSAAFPVMRRVTPGTVAFRHDALREAAHDSLPFRHRRGLHAAIAVDAVERGGLAEAELAFHFEQAGMLADAYATASAAGRAAAAGGAITEAVAMLERAVRLALDVDRPSVGDLMIELGEARSLLGDLDGADAAFVSAGRRGLDPRSYARACHGRADIALNQSRFQHARRLCRTGLAALESYGDEVADLRGRLLLDQAAVLDLSGRHDASLVPAAQAHALAVRTGNRTLEGMADLHLGMAHLARMRPEALECVDAAVAIFEDIGHDRYLNSALNNSGLVAMYLGRWELAIERYGRAADHGERCGNTVDRAAVELNIGFLLYRQGHLDEAEEHARRAMRIFDVVGIPQLSATARYLLSEVAAADGRLDVARRTMASARETFVELGDAAMIVDCDMVTMEQLLLAGHVAEANAMRDDVAMQLDSAEVPVVIAFERTAGRLEILTGADGGTDRLEGALTSAREHALLYDELLCLRAIIATDDGSGEVAPYPPGRIDRARTDHDALVRRLAVVRA
jgi:class 3 adenylate cyclase/tetratricopeptide (TPR) repeat protein